MPHESSLQLLELVLAEFTRPDNLFKFSELGVQTGFNVSRSVREYRLATPPANAAEALIRWVFLEPCPREVWEYLSPIIPYGAIVAEFQLARKLGRDLPGADQLNRRTIDDLCRLHPPTAGRAGGKVNLTLADVLHRLNLGQTGRALAKQLSNIANGWEEVTVLGLLLCDMFSEYGGTFQRWCRAHPGVLSSDVRTWVKLCKALHVFTRTTCYFPQPDGSLAYIGPEGARLAYGLDSIVGRTEQNPGYDPVSEIRMRLVDPTRRQLPTLDAKAPWSSEEAYDLALRRCCDEAVDSMMPQTIPLESFSSWYRARMFWAASGGAPGATVRWEAQGGAERMNKRGALLIIPESHIRKILEHSAGPVLWSKCAPKYENGKQRVIWNTAVEHYVIQAYVYDMLDKSMVSGTWNSAAHQSGDALTSTVQRLLRLHDSTGVMWDYSDFNINHTHEAMLALYDSSEHALLSRGATSRGHSYEQECRRDIRLAFDWLRASRVYTVLEDPASGLMARVRRSMQSGERATSYQNTTLNRAYTLLHHKWCRRFLGRTTLLGESYHQGDDVWALSRHVWDGVLACDVYNILGYAGAKHKIMCDYSGRGEYLRLHYDAQELKVSGYPIRGGMGLIAGEFFRDASHDPIARGGAFFDQYSKVGRRGGRLPTSLLALLLDKKASLSYTNSQGMVRHIRPDLAILGTPRMFGGYGLGQAFPLGSSAAVTGPVILNSLLQQVSTPREHQVHFAHLRHIAAICLPSGEGKTTLARRNPGIFIDHDDLLDVSRHNVLLRAARESGDWSLVQQYHRAVIEEAKDTLLGSVILTWGRDEVPSEIAFLGTFQLGLPTGVRANLSNRDSLRRRGELQVSASYLERDIAIWHSVSSWVRGLKFAATCEIAMPRYSHLGREQPPVLRSPRVDLDLFFGRESYARFDRASALQDFAIMHRIGATKAIDRGKRTILESALSGAFPAGEVSNRLAEYGVALKEWLDQSVLAQEPVLLSTIPAALMLEFTAQASRELADWLGTVTSFGIPDRFGLHRALSGSDHELARAMDMANLYGAASALVRPCGFSSEGVFSAALEECEPYVYPGRLGKYNRMLTTQTEGGRCAVGMRMLEIIRSGLSVDQKYFQLHYLEGRLDLIPPAYFGQGTLITTCARSFVLAFLEKRINASELYGQEAFASAVYRLEVQWNCLFILESAKYFGTPLKILD